MSLFGLLKRSKPPASPAIATPVVRELPPPAGGRDELANAPAAPSSTDLRQMLFDAIARGDERRLAALCREHRAFILDYADTWLIVPDDLLGNPVAADWYQTGVRLLTRLCNDDNAAKSAAA